jgi:hypothetical protein
MHTQTGLVLRHTTMGVCEAVPHENLSMTAIKNTTIYYQRTAVRLGNRTLHNDLHIPFVDTEINRFSKHYHHRLSEHQNPLIAEMTAQPINRRRLKRRWSADLFHTATGNGP